MVRFIKMLGEFLLSYRFSDRYAVPIAASPTDGASPIPTVGVPDKHQFAELNRYTKNNITKLPRISVNSWEFPGNIEYFATFYLLEN